MWLGLDIGTSGVKAVIVGERGDVVGEATAPLGVSRPRALWSEQDPEDWWTAVNDAVAHLPLAARAQVRAVGLAGQMHGAVLLDEADRPLRPAILWNDGRAGAECGELETACPELREVTGNAAMAGFTAPKLLWVRKHEPDLFDAIAHVLLPKDYVRLRMTGDLATDMSDASGTLWLDVGARRWSATLLDASGLRLSQMPELYEGDDVTGLLRAEVAAEWGMSPVPVAAGGGDNAAAAVGIGVVASGRAMLSLGTSGVIFVAGDRFRPSPEQGAHAFAHALPGVWHQMAVVLSAASAVDWVAATCGYATTKAAIDDAGSRVPFSGAEMFLPHLSGERTPHNDPGSTGVITGLTHSTTRVALVSAALEGVAFALAEGLAVLEAAGDPVETLQVVGGGAQSLAWGRVLAAALGRPLFYGPEGRSGPAVGAARLARLATGGRLSEVVVPPPVLHVVEPDADLLQAAADRFAAWRQVYPAIRHVAPSPVKASH